MSNKWPPNFSPHEFAQSGGHPQHVPDEYWPRLRSLAWALQAIRDAAGGGPLSVLSGYRSPEYDAARGHQIRDSQHWHGRAADIVCRDVTPGQLHQVVLQLIEDGTIPDGGVGLYKGFVHYDQRGHRARW